MVHNQPYMTFNNKRQIKEIVMKSQSYPERVFSLERYQELHNKGE